MENNNKESYALLDMDNSDSATDTTEIIIAPQKKKKLTKHRQHQRASHPNSVKFHKPVACGGRTVSLTLALVLLLCWFLTLTWLAIVLNAQIQRLDSTIQTVVAGNQGVPDALQKCHSLSKELQQNQTSLFLRLSELASQFSNFSNQVASISNGLNHVEQRFKTSPELINVPHDIETLTSNVASFGSQMKDLVSTVAQLKDTNTHLTETSHVLDANITSLRQKISEISLLKNDKPAPTVDTEALKSSINSVQTNLSLINQTLSSKLQWVTDDQNKDHKAIVILQDKSENVSSLVTTLQNEQSECNTKIVQVSALKSQVDQLNLQMTTINSHWNELLNKTSELSKSYSQLESNNQLLQSSMKEMKQSLSQGSSSSTNQTMH